MLLGDDVGHQTGDAGADVDGREVVAVGQPAGEDNVSVQNAANGVGDGLVGVIALHQHGVHPGDGASLEVAAALQQLGQLGVDGGGVAPGHRGLSHR